MFSTTNSLQLKKNQPNKLSNIKQDSELINDSIENSKVLNQNTNNFTNIVIKPDNDIPKTVYYKRMYQKLVQQNETSNFKHKMPIQKENNRSSKNINQYKSEGFNNDNIFIETPLDHNESKENCNSTLIIVESDVTLSECEIDTTTPVTEYGNPKKVKKNVCLESLTPAIISDQNMSNKTLKCISNLKGTDKVDSKIQHYVSNLPENKIIESLNENTESICIEKCNAKDNLKPDNEQFILTDIVHKQKSTNFDEIPSINNEIKQIPNIQKNIAIENKNNNLELTEEKPSSCVTCINSSLDNKLNKSINNIKSVSIKNEQELSSFCKQNKNKSNDIANKSFKNAITGTSFTDQTCKSFINIEVEQFPIKRKRTVIKKDNNSTLPLITMKKSSHDTCINSLMDSKLNISTKNVKKLSINDEKEVFSSFKQNNSASECKLPIIMHVNNLTQSDEPIKCSLKNTIIETNFVDKTDKPFYNIEVEQIPFKRKSVVREKGNNTRTILTENKKSSCVTHINSLIDNKCNVLTKNIKCLPVNNEKESFNSSKHISNKSEYNSPILQKKTIEKNAVKKTDLSIDINVEQGSKFKQSNVRTVLLHSNPEDNKQETKKGRRIQLITIKNHYSQPSPSFNGAKKKEIDVSQKSIHIEKEVESSSLFYIPQVKRRRTMNFSNNDS